MIAAAYFRQSGPEAESRLAKLFEASGDRLAGIVSTGHVALGWSPSSLVTLPKCASPLLGVALGAVDPSKVFRPGALHSPLGLRDPVALFLAVEQDLVLARGPFGGRPVYFAVQDDGDTVIACSDLLPVVKQLARPTEVDIDGLAAIVSVCVGLDPTRTPYSRVRRLDACQVVRFSAGKMWVSVEVPSPPAPRAGKVEALAAEFREVLVDTVARDARRLSRATVMTGGGLDSSGLLAVAKLGYRRGRHGCDFGVVAMDFGGVGDDRPHLQALCSSLGIEPLRVPPREAVPLIPSVLNADAAPLYWATYPMEMAAIQRAGQVATQALFTGSGGDYVTFGDLSLYADEALRRFVPALWGAARLRTMSSSSRRSRMMDLVLRPAVRKLVPRSWLRRRRANRIRNSRRWAWAGPRLRAFLLDAEDFERDEQEESWYAWLARSRDLVRVADLRGQSERKSQLVERCPYLDANVVEFVASIPREARLCGHDDRGLFREAMRGLLPESIRTRSDKAGFESMLNEVGSGAYATGALSRLVRMEALGDLRLVDPAAFQSALAKAVAEGDGFGWGDAWPALCAEAFLLDESVRRGDPSVWSIEAVN